ncbi:regulatory helix-turn-helix protein, lysR family [Variovorax sp. OV700]|nr:regulatory helix-turn-helix protein, lysR family [Variovorax sp. OV700]
MLFDLTDLRLFVATAELGNLTRAAERQHLSLAAASARIKALESQAGLQLLQREARGVRLLPPGEAFLHHARLVLHTRPSSCAPTCSNTAAGCAAICACSPTPRR